jgi:ATP-dependent Clp protease protease subunit
MRLQTLTNLPLMAKSGLRFRASERPRDPRALTDEIFTALTPENRAKAGFWGWDTKLEGDVLEIRIYDVIGSGWFGGVGADEIARKLEEFPDAKSIRLRINSPGGDAFDGVAIMNLLRQHKADVEAFVDGYAASAATIIAMAADTVHMGTASMFMIHEPWTCSYGNAGDLRSTADFLDKLNDGIVDLYKNRSGLSEERVREMLEAETWMSAQETVDNGFADDVVEAEKPEDRASNKNPAAPVAAFSPQLVIAALQAFAAVSGSRPKENTMDPKNDPKPQAADVEALKARNTTLEAQNTELTTSNTQLREELREARTEAHNAKADLVKAQADLTELTKKTNDLEDRVVKQEVEALVGDKIAANEVEDFVSLAKANRPLFESMLEKRTSLQLTERKIDGEPKPAAARKATTGDASAEFASL